MNVRFYLIGKVQQHQDFKREERTDQQKRKYVDYSLSGVSLYFQDDRWYADVRDLHSPIPGILVNFVEEISVADLFEMRVKRELGIYRHKSADIRLTTERGLRGETKYRMCGRGRNIHDLRHVVDGILTGSIRPTESFEGEQTGLSRQQLEEQLIETAQLLEEAEEQIRQITQQVEEVQGDLQQLQETHHELTEEARSRQATLAIAEEFREGIKELARRLNSGWWPLVDKLAIYHQLVNLVGEED